MFAKFAIATATAVLAAAVALPANAQVLSKQTSTTMQAPRPTSGTMQAPAPLPRPTSGTMQAPAPRPAPQSSKLPNR